MELACVASELVTLEGQSDSLRLVHRLAICVLDVYVVHYPGEEDLRLVMETPYTDS